MLYVRGESRGAANTPPLKTNKQTQSANIQPTIPPSPQNTPTHTPTNTRTQSAIEARLKEEESERFALKAEREAERAQNILEHRQEIMQRPARGWFQVRAFRLIWFGGLLGYEVLVLVWVVVVLLVWVVGCDARGCGCGVLFGGGEVIGAADR